MSKPSILRWLTAILVTAASAPLLSPAYWVWTVVVFDGATGFSELVKGLMAGALVAYAFSWPAVVAGVFLFASIVYWKADRWFARRWWLWLCLGVVIASIAVPVLAVLFGGPDDVQGIIIVALVACAPAGGLASLVFRRVLLGSNKNAGRLTRTPTGSEAGSDG